MALHEFHGYRLAGVGAPVADDDAATKKYVDDNSGNGNGGSSSLVDLGTITVTALVAGAQTLRTPAAGSALWVLPSPSGFVASDGPVDVCVASRLSVTAALAPLFQWSPGGTFYADSFNLPAHVFQGRAIMDGTAVKAVLQTSLNAYSIVSAAPAWQANHAYAASVALTITTGRSRRAGRAAAASLTSRATRAAPWMTTASLGRTRALCRPSGRCICTR